MKRNTVTLVAVLIAFFFLLLPVQGYAQRGTGWRGSGGWGMASQYGRMYDVEFVETITGQVVKVERITPIRGMSYGVHLVVKTDSETISIHLGPAWYVENQDIKIEPRDKVEIKGSRITLEGKPVIIAAEVRKGESVLKLRDEGGVPVWSGWRRR
jgi:hypothetical protein